MDVKKHEPEKPNDSFELDLIFNVDETSTVRAMFREKVHKLTKEDGEVDTHDLGMAFDTGEAVTIYTNNIENLAGDLDTFHKCTTTMTKWMASKLELPYQDRTISHRYILGEKAKNLAAEIREKALGFTAMQHATLNEIDTTFLQEMGVDPASLAA
jgi:hypothetical protein